jgi:hypothetical protein
MDPYVKVVVGGKTFRSKTHNGGGKTPQWTDTFEFKRTTEDIIKFLVYEEDTFSDDFIGEAMFQLSRITDGPLTTFHDYITIDYRGGRAGDLLVEITFYPVVGYAPAPGPPMMQPMGTILLPSLIAYAPAPAPAYTTQVFTAPGIEEALLLAPVYAPSYAPSYAPTYAPSGQPVYQPSYQPTYQPTYQPSGQPAYAPQFQQQPPPGYAPAYAPQYPPPAPGYPPYGYQHPR